MGRTPCILGGVGTSGCAVGAERALVATGGAACQKGRILSGMRPFFAPVGGLSLARRFCISALPRESLPLRFERDKNFASKFGRAKSYGDKTIGTPDAGAVSMARFFKGLAQA